MPNRYVRDSRTSKRLAALSDFAERGFWRLVQAADDYGRFEADAAVILAQCFPRAPAGITLARIEKMLSECASAQLICLYEIGGACCDRYGEFRNEAASFFNRRAKFSKYPAPPSPPILLPKTLTKTLTKTVNESSGASRRPLARAPGRISEDLSSTLERLTNKFKGESGR